jgi:hypothetical protein
LVPFVGNGVKENFDHYNRETEVKLHYSKINLFSDEEIWEVLEHSLIPPTESDYNWKEDKELGWLFGGEYPCYSLRNKEHSGGEEGLFPFEEWDHVLTLLDTAT